VDISGSIYEVLNYFRIINGAKMWSLDDEWAEFKEILCFVLKETLET
jgi:hypothetical protein